MVAFRSFASYRCSLFVQAWVHLLDPPGAQLAFMNLLRTNISSCYYIKSKSVFIFFVNFYVLILYPDAAYESCLSKYIRNEYFIMTPLHSRVILSAFDLTALYCKMHPVFHTFPHVLIFLCWISVNHFSLCLFHT